MQLFYSNPNRSFYVREITRKIDEQINSVRRELANLLSIGIISSDTNTDNNRLYYEVNQQYAHYKPLAAIFGGKKFTADSIVDDDAKAFKSLGHVEVVLLTGQFTRDDRAGVDVLVVGDINQTQLTKFMSDLEAKEGKELRYAAMPLNEFTYRQQVKDRFLSNVMEAKKQVLIDKQNLLTEVKNEE